MILGLVAAFGATSAAHADVTLSNTPDGGSLTPFGRGYTQTYGEVFTAPITGTLTSFTLYVDQGVGSLYGGVGQWSGGSSFALNGASTANLYTSAQIPSDAAGFYTFAANTQVVAGRTYVAYLSTYGDLDANNAVASMPTANSPAGIDYAVWTNSSDPAGSTPWSYAFNIGSFQFSATFASPVPEPGTWVLTLAGIGLIGYGLRRRPLVAPA
jgi:hypothetical protein